MVDLIAVEKMETAGAIAWWRLSGAVDAAALAAAWGEVGLSEELLPPLPTPEVAMRRAMKAQEEKSVLIRKLPTGDGFAIVKEHRDVQTNELTYTTQLKASLDKLGRLQFDNPNHPLCVEIEATFERVLGQLSQQDISGWLCRLVEKVNAVSLRDTGGVYFVPRANVELWRQMVKVIAGTSSHNIFEVPALKSEEAVIAILHAVTAEAETEAKAMEAELLEDERGARWLNARVSRCEEMTNKLSAYDSLLGTLSNGLKSRIDDLKANLAAAALQATAEEEAA